MFRRYFLPPSSEVRNFLNIIGVRRQTWLMQFMIINDTSATPQYDSPKIRPDRQTDRDRVLKSTP